MLEVLGPMPRGWARQLEQEIVKALDGWGLQSGPNMSLASLVASLRRGLKSRTRPTPWRLIWSW